MLFRIEIKTNAGTIVDHKDYDSWKSAEEDTSKFAKEIGAITYSVYRTK